MEKHERMNASHDTSVHSTQPSYADLLRRQDAPAGSSWGIWGADDELGTLNRLTARAAVAAAAHIRAGERFTLDLALPLEHADQGAPFTEQRSPAHHHVFTMAGPYLDDRLDAFFPQASTQIDALRHCRHQQHGYYNGHPQDRMVAGDPLLGIGRVAEVGIFGRGVLLDVAGVLGADAHASYDPSVATAITVDHLEQVRRAEGVDYEPGDILMIRTGAAAGPGLEQSHEMLAYLWDNGFSVLASDNAAVEVWPAVATSPFRDPDEQADGLAGLMHPVLIGLLGFTLGERWDLDTLAHACHADVRFVCALSAVPLNVPGGVGSPANAMAIR
jgi:hypothetical protein